MKDDKEGSGRPVRLGRKEFGAAAARIAAPLRVEPAQQEVATGGDALA